jgi:hypothetical protein
VWNAVAHRDRACRRQAPGGGVGSTDAELTTSVGVLRRWLPRSCRHKAATTLNRSPACSSSSPSLGTVLVEPDPATGLVGIHLVANRRAMLQLGVEAALMLAAELVGAVGS